MIQKGAKTGFGHGGALLCIFCGRVGAEAMPDPLIARDAAVMAGLSLQDAAGVEGKAGSGGGNSLDKILTNGREG